MNIKTREDAIKFVNDAKTPSERARRKEILFWFLYGGGPWTMKEENNDNKDTK